MYLKDSYFKTQVYAEHDWKSFYQMHEANTVIDADRYDIHLVNAAIFYATNKLREKHGLPALKYSKPLTDAAMAHSQQMLEKNFFNHLNTYVGDLKTPEIRVKLFGGTFAGVGENIDYSNIDNAGKTTFIDLGEKIVDAYYHSAPHKKNMLSNYYTFIGCAGIFEKRDKGGFRYIKSTQDYGSNQPLTK